MIKAHQNPNNSSRPPSSRAPWERPLAGNKDSIEEVDASVRDAVGTDTSKPKRNEGKEPGAQGIGRTQVLKAQETRCHRPNVCVSCADAAPGNAPSVVYAGFQSVDLVWDDPEQPGLHLRVTDYRFYEIGCGCGHHTRARSGEGPVEDPTLEPVALNEWRLLGLGLETLIVALHLRFRMSRRRMRKFLHDWLGLSLSVGTLDRTLREAAAATAPLEEELIAAVVAGDLLHADETSWPQLTRKAQELIDSFDREAQAFRRQVQHAFETLSGALHAAGDGLPRHQAPLLAELQAACVCLLGHRHVKARTLSVELWNDWNAIFRVLENPQWPITKNDAERALRHWVIARRIMMGTRGAAGSCVFTLLACVMETCRQRSHVPWPYLADEIGERRAGRAAVLQPASMPGL